MNNGKICVSVCARTADELVERLEQAKALADVIEIRFDCLDQIVPEHLWARLKQFRKNFAGKLLATFRAPEQGGQKALSVDERNKFWLESNVDEFTDWADLEEDISIEKLRGMWGKIVFEKFITSSHDFEKVPEDLTQIYERIKATNADVIKIAVQTRDIADSLPVWQLLKRAKSENKQIIPIAMGESGKWTRILGLAHGALMSYAALDPAQETAPGQVTAKDLIEVYRAKELDETTGVYGILGNNVGISLSPLIHNTAFKFHNLNAVFVPLQVLDLDGFIKRMVKPGNREVELNFKGFSVTIPHKQSIIKHLDYLDETARKIGAVNTVKIVDGKLHGYNTDAHGFIEPLKTAYGDLQDAKVAILGAGGAARACVYALKQNGAEVTVFARDPAKAQELADDFGVDLDEIRNPKSEIRNQDIVVNTTPLGMKGKAEGETPLTARELEGVKLVYDLVYVPFQTRLMSEADKADVPKIGGMAMLVAQAAEQQRIWTGLDAPLKEISREVLKRLQ